MKNIIVLFLLPFFLCACHKSKKTHGYPTLEASLEIEDVSIMELFDSIEAIPLETNDSSLLIWPDKILYWNGHYGIFDSKNPALFVFDKTGTFVRKIGNRGEGPEEYTEIYDVIQNKEEKEIYMLSPFGEIVVYSTDGKFIRRIQLPQKTNYQSFESFSDYFITWTLPSGEEEYGISVISKNTMQCMKNYWQGNRNLYSLYSRVFHKYGENIFFFRPFGREVYQINKDDMNIAYQWDFGKDNYSVKDWGISETKSGGGQESSLLINQLRESTIPYVICNQAQNNKYYYSTLIFGFTPKGRHHLFYRKADGKTFFFNKTSEGIKLNPLFWSDEFVLCLADNESLADYEEVLGNEEMKKILNRNEEDNPILIKYYYK